METSKKFSKHYLADKVPLILSAVLMLAGAFLPNIIISSIIDPFYNESNGITLQILWCIGVVIISFLCLLLFDKWFSPEYESSMRSEGLAYGLKLLLPTIIFWTVWMTAKAVMKQAKFYPLDLEVIVKGLRPGVSEEIFFRAIGIALILRKYRKKENLWVPLVFTSLIFGLTHYTNVETLDELPMLTINALFATSFGVIFSVVFMMSGSIWPTIIVHSAYDIAVICMEYAEDSVDWLSHVDIAGTLLIMVCMIVLFHRNREKIAALWDTRWHNKI